MPIEATGPGAPVVGTATPGPSRRRFLLLPVAMLAGCGYLPRSGPDGPSRWEKRRDRISTITRFGFNGRLALRSARDALNARVRWRQDGDEYRIRLGGLIGEAAVELRGGPAGVELLDRDGVHHADSPESLLQERMGWSFPLHGLRYWVLGITAPGAPVERLELDRQGRPLLLLQSGWRVVYRRYSEVGDLVLPERLDFERAELEARLVVGDWTIED